MKLNNEGFVDLKCNNELTRLIDKIIRKHKPNTPMEFALLNQQILSNIDFNVAMTELKVRCKRIKKAQKSTTPKKAGHNYHKKKGSQSITKR